MIMPFINEQLDDGDLEVFLEHIKTCPECMEELEVYYTLITSMKQLDDDEELSDDYHQDLVDLLNKSETGIENKKSRHKLKNLTLMIVVGIIVLTSSYTIGDFIVEDIIKKATVSDFMPEGVELINRSDLPIEIERQFSDIYIYLKQTDKEGAASMGEYYGDAIWDDMIIQKEFGQATYIPEWTVLNY